MRDVKARTELQQASKTAAKPSKSLKEPVSTKSQAKKKKKQAMPKIRVEKEELSSPVGSELSHASFDDSITSAALKDTIFEPPKAKAKAKSKSAPKGKPAMGAASAGKKASKK